MNRRVDTEGQLRVVKLGGSLLEWPPVFSSLQSWLSCQAPATTLLVVGGGGAVDWWRAMDLAHHCDSAWIHDRALTAMTENARLVFTHLPHAEWVTSFDDLRFCRDGLLTVLDSYAAIVAEERLERLPPLPRSWQVSADSIAAWVAVASSATELVLLKSCNAPQRRREWCTQGFVDSHFDNVSFPAERVRAVNLRGYE